MATTTNYAWTTPDDSALLGQGAAAIRTALSAVDTTLGGQKNIKQIVTGTYALAVTSSTTTPVATNLTATITPSKSTNQVLVVVVQGGCGKFTGNTDITLQLLRGATVILTSMGIANTGGTVSNYVGNQVQVFLDSPATTAATTYSTKFYSTANIASTTVQAVSSPSYIFLFEIGV